MTTRRGWTSLLLASLLVTTALGQAGAAATERSASVNPLSFPGADIGAKANAAIAAMPAAGGTVHIFAGEYSFATTIKITRPGQQAGPAPVRARDNRMPTFMEKLTP